MVDFSLNATARNDMGKGASRRLRRLAQQVPAIIYGGSADPQSISLAHKDVVHALENEGFYSHIINLNVDGNSQEVILKDMQRHPAKPVILHMDFQRVDKTHKITVKVPLHFINEETAIGVKQGGGIVSHSMTELEISCLPQDLPEYLEVDLASVELGGTVHISDVKLPKGVESVALSHGADHDLPVAAIIKPRGQAETEETDSADEAAGKE
jgi:large subunit ribosomal protein L25